MTVDAHRPRGTASDQLMTQIDAAKVLPVYALLANQAEAMEISLSRGDDLRRIPRLADDVVSVAARDLFQAKIDSILDAQYEHLLEIREAAERLKEAAEQYRYTEEDISAALSSARERFGLPPLQGR